MQVLERQGTGPHDELQTSNKISSVLRAGGATEPTRVGMVSKAHR